MSLVANAVFWCSVLQGTETTDIHAQRCRSIHLRNSPRSFAARQELATFYCHSAGMSPGERLKERTNEFSSYGMS
jgi:hypothetical protein